MANVGNQKQKLLYIMEIFLRETDEEHPITAAQIIEKLEAREIVAERKSIYRDIRALQDYGMDIEKAPEQNGFYLAERTFELAELKLLVDAVAASKFITEKKSRELVQKIEHLGSAYQGQTPSPSGRCVGSCQNGKRAYLLHDRRDLSVY